MIKLLPYQVCPFSSFCNYKYDDFVACNGMNAARKIIFICELWAENYPLK